MNEVPDFAADIRALPRIDRLAAEAARIRAARTLMDLPSLDGHERVGPSDVERRSMVLAEQLMAEAPGLHTAWIRHYVEARAKLLDAEEALRVLGDVRMARQVTQRLLELDKLDPSKLPWLPQGRQVALSIEVTKQLGEVRMVVPAGEGDGGLEPDALKAALRRIGLTADSTEVPLAHRLARQLASSIVPQIDLVVLIGPAGWKQTATAEALQQRVRAAGRPAQRIRVPFGDPVPSAEALTVAMRRLDAAASAPEPPLIIWDGPASTAAMREPVMDALRELEDMRDWVLCTLAACFVLPASMTPTGEADPVDDIASLSQAQLESEGFDAATIIAPPDLI